MKRVLSIFAVLAAVTGFSFSAQASAGNWYVLDPVDMFGENNHHDDAYWVHVYKETDLAGVEHLYLEAVWSGATFEFNAASNCFENDEYQYCAKSNTEYTLSHDGSVIESGSITAH